MNQAGIWYIMWSNIGKVAEYKDSLDLLPSPQRSVDSGTGKPINDAMHVYADCHAAVKGIFLGIVLKSYSSFFLIFQNVNFSSKRISTI